MNTTYIQKNIPIRKKITSKATSFYDNSTENEALQRKADMANNAAQRAEAPRPNNTGMPDNLKAGIESLSGFSMDDVHVHYNSSKPATVQALAYTQGTDIHVAPGQEKHLPHEAWHIAQQMAGRVSPTTNINGMPINDNAELEHEADVMGEKAVTQRKASIKTRPLDIKLIGKWAYNMGISFGKNKKMSHSHIIFSNDDEDVDIENRCHIQYDIMDGAKKNNIGFHCTTSSYAGAGGFFAEKCDKYGEDGTSIYEDGDQSVPHNENRNLLLSAIEDNASKPIYYQINDYNCHRWADDVKNTYDKKKNQFIKSQVDK